MHVRRLCYILTRALCAVTTGGSGGGFEAGGSALQRSVSRLFQERVQYFGGVTFHRGSILAGAHSWEIGFDCIEGYGQG